MNRKKFIKSLGIFTIGILLSRCKDEKKNIIQKLEPAKKNRIKFKKEDFKFISKGHRDYDKLRVLYNKNLNKFPSSIILCKSAQEISNVIQYANNSNQQITIKSGGHSFEGASVGTNTICINLAEMNKIEWLNDDLVKIQAGCKLSQVYKEIIPKGKIIPGGSCGSVGISGLTLGGGYGFFSRMYGLTCDNLLDVTMVDGLGNIHTENREVLWACQGGNNGNLGVLTDLTFKLNDAPKTFSEMNFDLSSKDPEKIINLFVKFLDITSNLPNNIFSSFFISSRFSSIKIIYFDDFDPQKIKESILEVADSYYASKSNNLLQSVEKRNGSPKPLYFKNASCGYFNNSNEIIEAITTSIPIILRTKQLMYQVNSLGGAISELGNSDTAYPHRNFQYLSELQTYWNSKTTNTDEIFSDFSLIQKIHFENGIKSHYVNYPSHEFKNFRESYYGVNLNKLKSMKTKFDPQNIFYNEQGLV